MWIEKAIIVGAGPAGLAAANQLSLYGIDPLVLESASPGGLLRNAGEVRNYPGVPRGITGKELVASFPVPDRLLITRATGISRTGDGKYSLISRHDDFLADTVIVATGTVPVTPELPRVPPEVIHFEIADLNTDGVQSAAVIGGGDAALDYALSLSRTIPVVNVYARSGFSGAVPGLLQRAGAAPGITLRHLSEGFTAFAEDIIVPACGRRPDLEFIDDVLLSLPPEDGSFHLCGDCRNGIFRQTAIAVGDGVKAAMAAVRFLKGKD